MLEKLSFWKNRDKDVNKKIDMDNIPEHVAIIMDGNGRWAKRRGLPRIAGHHEGMKVVRRIVKLANSMGIKVMTLYAFSTENWKRPKTEVEYLMKLPEEFLDSFLPELIEENVQVRTIGQRNALPSHTLRAVENAIEKTKHNDGLILNFALNYGSRDELVSAIQAIASDVGRAKYSITDIDDRLVNSYLMSGDLKDPDLLIRTSGEIRLSNFMLWQLAYSEFWFTNVLWPDFTDKDLLDAISEYQKRTRRYGGL